MSNEPLSHEELEQARYAIDFRTGKPAIENPVYKHDLFRAQVARQAEDERQAAARAVPRPNVEGLAVLAEVSAWVDPRTGVRAYTAANPDGTAMREAVEELRRLALAGEALPPDLVADARSRMAAAQAEADAKKAADEKAELERHRRARDGYA